MIFIDFVFAVTIALLLVLLFSLAFQYRGPWNNALLFFAVVLMATWAGGVWLSPIGPAVGGFYWLPFLVAGLVVSLLLAATAIPSKPESTVELVDPTERRARRWAAGTALGIAFWVLMMLLLAAVFARYVA
jgi:hypothetical protein